MRLRPKKEEPPPKLPDPFPIDLYLVGVDRNGNEVLRYDLRCNFTDFGQTVHLADPTLELLQ